jgi:hypothetical protein
MERKLSDKLKMAPNFYYREFVKSNTATRLGIVNIPGEKEWIKIEELAQHVLQPIRNHFGPIRITSGYRSPELNVKIGGSKFSNHCRGEAADIEPWNSSIKLIDIMEWTVQSLDFREVIAEFFPNGWLHLTYRINGNSKIIKLKDNNHNYNVVTIGYIKELYDTM